MLSKLFIFCFKFGEHTQRPTLFHLLLTVTILKIEFWEEKKKETKFKSITKRKKNLKTAQYSQNTNQIVLMNGIFPDFGRDRFSVVRLSPAHFNCVAIWCWAAFYQRLGDSVNKMFVFAFQKCYFKNKISNTFESTHEISARCVFEMIAWVSSRKYTNRCDDFFWTVYNSDHFYHGDVFFFFKFTPNQFDVFDRRSWLNLRTWC